MSNNIAVSDKETDQLVLSVDQVRFGFRTRPDFLGPVNFDMRGGERWAIVGPNGAGKSTLLRLMAGLIKPSSGRIKIARGLVGRMSCARESGSLTPHGRRPEKPVAGPLTPAGVKGGSRGSDWGPLPDGRGSDRTAASPCDSVDDFGRVDLMAIASAERARFLAYVPQHLPSDIDETARDIVLLGRYPHRSLGVFESAEDHRIAEHAMELTETLAFSDRSMRTLSGGEAQRVHLAATLAQQPAILLLDEPTASLDLQHQLAFFDLMRQCARRDGLAVIVVTHDLNLASRFCSHVLLLNDGKAVAMGSPEQVITPDVLAPVYHVELAALNQPGDGVKQWIVAIGPRSGGRA